MKNLISSQNISRNSDKPETTTGGNTGGSSTTQNTFSPIFTNELKVLMTGFGDNEHPYSDSVSLLEEYVIEYIQNIAVLAYKRSRRKGSNEIQLKDLLYVIKNDKKKFYRIPILLSFYETIKKTKNKMEHNFFDKKSLNKEISDLVWDNK